MAHFFQFWIIFKLFSLQSILFIRNNLLDVIYFGIVVIFLFMDKFNHHCFSSGLLFALSSRIFFIRLFFSRFFLFYWTKWFNFSGRFKSNLVAKFLSKIQTGEEKMLKKFIVFIFCHPWASLIRFLPLLTLILLPILVLTSFWGYYE